MKLGNKTKVPDALLELSIDFGKRMGSGWSYLNDEALNCMQGFSKSTSPQRFKSNRGENALGQLTASWAQVHIWDSRSIKGVARPLAVHCISALLWRNTKLWTREGFPPARSCQNRQKDEALAFRKHEWASNPCIPLSFQKYLLNTVSTKYCVKSLMHGSEISLYCHGLHRWMGTSECARQCPE